MGVSLRLYCVLSLWLLCVPGAISAEAPAPRGPGLIFGPGPAEAWDAERVSCPKVLQGDDGVWRMWYYGRDPSFDRRINLPTGRVGLATSGDGISWQRVVGPLSKGAVFEPHPASGRFDSSHVGISDIHFAHGLYWMWYFGGGDSASERHGYGFPLRIGAAVSADGLNWQRLDGPFAGALLDVGEPGSFDHALVAWPHVVDAGSQGWRMYYHSVDEAGYYRVGLAVSRDGFVWERHGEILGPGEPGRFDDLGVSTRQVLRLGEQWVMLYEGVSSGRGGADIGRAMGIAVSADGVNWERIDGPEDNGAILAPSPAGSGRWDHRIGCPWVVPMDDGSLRMYYIGSSERPVGRGADSLVAVHQIGLAVSDGDLTRWRRWVSPP